MIKNKLLYIALFSALIIVISLGAAGGCNNNGGNGTDGDGDDDLNGGGAATTLNVSNEGDATTVYAVFSSDSCTTISDWSTGSPISCTTAGDTTCTVTANASICSFPIASGDTCTLPVKSGCLTSINFAFNAGVVTQPCGLTPGTGPSLAEVSINGSNCSKQPGCQTAPCDCIDISLVQGYAPPNISITLSEGNTTLGPTVGATGNQSVFGVFPVGCTNCVNRGGCPCGIDCSDTSQCHQGGTPDDPDIPCQASQPTGGTITINILAD